MRRILLILFTLLSCSAIKAQQRLECWQAGSAVTKAEVAQFGIDNCFKICTIDDAVFARMKGKSYKAECTTPRSELRYIKALHITQDGVIMLGEMVVNRAIAEDIVTILRHLYEAEYPIERMVLVDNYNADDEASMRANNSSAFNYRHTPGGTRLSAHSRGMAVDINPLYNPCVYVKSGRVLPPEGNKYAHDRDKRKDIPSKIDATDLCYRLFVSRGFRWGGTWRTIKDYQHFEK